MAKSCVHIRLKGVVIVRADGVGVLLQELCKSSRHDGADGAETEEAFQDPVCLRPFLNQLQDTPTIQASEFNRFTVLAEGRKQWSTRI